MPETRTSAPSRWPIGVELPQRPSRRSSEPRGLAFDWHREIPIFGAIVGIFALLFAGLQLAPYFSQRWQPPQDPVNNSVNAFLRNPAFELTPAEAALQIGGRLRLGDLAKIFKAASTNPVARAFVDAFLANRPLREALQRYLRDKNAKAFAQALAHSPEFSRLLAEFMKNGDFRELLASFSAQSALQNRGAELPDEPSSGSLELTRSGGLFEQASDAAVGLGRQNMNAEASSGWLGSSMSVPGRRRTGPGYDGQPQPGEEPTDGSVDVPIPVARQADTGVTVDATNAPVTNVTPAPLPPPTAAGVGCAALSSYANTNRDASAPLQACINQTPPSGVLQIPPGSYTVSKPLVVDHPITVVTAGNDPTNPTCTAASSKGSASTDCAVLKKDFNTPTTTTNQTVAGVFETPPQAPVPINVVVDVTTSDSIPNNTTGTAGTSSTSSPAPIPPPPVPPAPPTPPTPPPAQ